MTVRQIRLFDPTTPSRVASLNPVWFLPSTKQCIMHLKNKFLPSITLINHLCSRSLIPPFILHIYTFVINIINLYHFFHQIMCCKQYLINHESGYLSDSHFPVRLIIKAPNVNTYPTIIYADFPSSRNLTARKWS